MHNMPIEALDIVCLAYSPGKACVAGSGRRCYLCMTTCDNGRIRNGHPLASARNAVVPELVRHKHRHLRQKVRSACTFAPSPECVVLGNHAAGGSDHAAVTCLQGTARGGHSSDLRPVQNYWCACVLSPKLGSERTCQTTSNLPTLCRLAESSCVTAQVPFRGTCI